MQTQRSKLEPKYERGIFLGYSASNTYFVGVWREDHRCAAGEKFSVIENRDCKFDESTLISNVDDLKVSSGGTFVPFAPPSSLRDEVSLPGPGVVPEEPDQSPVGAPQSGGDPSSSEGGVDNSGEVVSEVASNSSPAAEPVADDVAPQNVATPDSVDGSPGQEVFPAPLVRDLLGAT